MNLKFEYKHKYKEKNKNHFYARDPELTTVSKWICDLLISKN